MNKHIARGTNEELSINLLKIDTGIEDDREKQEGTKAPAKESVTMLKVAQLELSSAFPKDDFLQTNEWRRLLIEFIPTSTLMTMRLLCKDWWRVADNFIDGMIESGAMIVYGGKDIWWKEALASEERHKLVLQVVFLLNITKVGNKACFRAVNLVVVDFPEGAESIGARAFSGCSSLTTVYFPTTLRFIGVGAFQVCSSLDNVDLLQTNLQEIGGWAFWGCSELKSMVVPDSLQTLGNYVFVSCPKLVSSDISLRDNNAVVAHLRSQKS
ncbi:hypothetical protein TrVE_jg9258 [Triparma verrucosa]|uniref:Uncharacterized protein n=1 Tax=Triparma verrucosa TaxID=1606542 RepID=A0A9W7EUR4_9STRA|nr:hypothetical protein TrVE_jg9258 [Triparma verrucosa]